MSNPSSSGNGSVYKDGYAIGQNAAIKQNEMNNNLSGGKRRRIKATKRRRSVYKGGDETVVQPIHASYPNNGIQALNTDLTQVTAQQQSNAQFDGNAAKGGSKKGRTNKRRTNRRKTNRRKTNRRTKSRRHM